MAQLKRIPRTAWLLAAAQLLLLSAVLFSLHTLMNVPASESKRANGAGQRVIIDAITGLVSSLSAPDKATFDVAPTPEPTPETSKPAPETPAPAATEPPVSPPKETPASEPAPTAPETPAATPSPKATLLPLSLTPEKVHISAVARSQASLTEAPVAAITDTTDAGTLPKHANGASPSTVYARPYTWPSTSSPSMAILVTGLGINDAVMKDALALPPEISLSFSPYGAHSREWSVYARNLGHEVWLDMPSQTAAFPTQDPGPLGIYTGLAPTEIVTRLRKAMQAIPGFVGFVLPPDQTILTAGNVIMPAVEELRLRGLLVAVGGSSVSPESIPHLGEVRNELLFARFASPADASAEDVSTQLERAQIAAMDGTPALAVVPASPAALKALSSWAAHTKPSSKLTLVPASALPTRPAS